MHFAALATDFDETLAVRGKVPDETVDALQRLKDADRRLLLVSGRELDDLQEVFPHLGLFDEVVAENGPLLWDPATGDEDILIPGPPDAFRGRLAELGVEPLSAGRVVVATLEQHRQTVLDVIQELGLELQLIFNKGSVMVLPAGMNKGVGLNAAMERLGLERDHVVAVGDAENDHSLLEAAGFPVAVANALESLKQRAALVTKGAASAGVAELADLIIEDALEWPVVELPDTAIRGDARYNGGTAEG